MSNRNPELEQYKNLLCTELNRLYPTVRVEPEWASMRDEFGLYSPRLDIAVGPFATHGRYEREYDDLMESNKSFIMQLLNAHKNNIRDYGNYSCRLTYNQLKFKNINARCFLAIEIENKVSRKHLIGGAVNASALGRIGIVIPWTKEKMRAMVKLRRYLEFLASVGKNTFNTTNLLIINKDQFLQALIRTRF